MASSLLHCLLALHYLVASFGVMYFILMTCLKYSMSSNCKRTQKQQAISSTATQLDIQTVRWVESGCFWIGFRQRGHLAKSGKMSRMACNHFAGLRDVLHWHMIVHFVNLHMFTWPSSYPNNIPNTTRKIR